MIDLHTASTPNGHKASVTLEELGLEYAVHPIDLSKGEQKREAFLALNPNGRIPVFVDHDADGLVVFESGAIMIHLAEKAGRLLPRDLAGRSRTIQWLMFQMGGIGAMSGVSVDGLPGLRRWLDAIKERPACRRGIEVPVKVPSLLDDEKATARFAENARRTLQRQGSGLHRSPAVGDRDGAPGRLASRSGRTSRREWG